MAEDVFDFHSLKITEVDMPPVRKSEQERNEQNRQRTLDRRSAIWERDGRMCGLCQQAVDNPERDARHPCALQIDHIVPRALGGTNDLDNVQATHSACNNLRNSDVVQTPEEIAARWERMCEKHQRLKGLPMDPEKSARHSRERMEPQRYRDDLARMTEMFERTGTWNRRMGQDQPAGGEIVISMPSAL